MIESLKTGIQEILSHKLQSFLTMLGVIFGVAAVISMVSIGEGAQREALEQLRRLGTNTIIAKRVEPEPSMILKELQKSPYGLNYEDMKSAEAIMPFLDGCSPIHESENTVRFNNKSAKAPVIGTNEQLPKITNLSLEGGRFITPMDIENSSMVCVLGSDVKRKLFAYEGAVGKDLMIGQFKFKCVGVLSSHKSSSLVAMTPQNDSVYVPITSAVRNFNISSMEENVHKMANLPKSRDDKRVISGLLKARYPLIHAPLSMIIFRTRSASDLEGAGIAIRNMLSRKHGGLKNFSVIIPTELLNQHQQTQRIFNIIMGAIAGISLIVGGIGIMNIMLASVTQRTREIGIRRCLGATRGNILSQFLTESLIITMTGGALGVVLGALLAKAISLYAGWQTVIAVNAVLSAVGVSTFCGIIFGIYPAWKAAATDPIKALKYD